MKSDLIKGISNINYNLLNLPSSLFISNSLGSATNTYVYSAAGSKLRVNKGSFHADYVGNVIYENNVLKRILVEGGYYEGGIYYFLTIWVITVLLLIRVLVLFRVRSIILSVWLLLMVQIRTFNPISMGVRNWIATGANLCDLLGFTIDGVSSDGFLGYGAKDGAKFYDMSFGSDSPFDFDEGKHFIGPSMVVLGKNMKLLKPVGALSSRTGSSIASYVLSNTLRINIGKTGSSLALALTGARTSNLGRFIGRMFPGVGWGITAIDCMYSRVAKPNINQIQNNIMCGNNPLDNTYNPTTGEYYIYGGPIFGF